MKTSIAVLALLALASLSAGAADDKGFVRHPAPKEPIYLRASRYDALKARLAPPPAKGSDDQARDEAELVAAQKSRSVADCEAAQREVFVGLKSFFGAPDGPLDDRAVERLAPFFEQIRNDGDYFIQRFKKDFPRPRPFLYMKDLDPCVPKEVTGAYPSGHAVLSKLYALVLADFFPQLKDKLEARARQIADHRVMSGVHHPSDVDAGRAIGGLIHAELGKSKRFRSDARARAALVQR